MSNYVAYVKIIESQDKLSITQVCKVLSLHGKHWLPPVIFSDTLHFRFPSWIVFLAILTTWNTQSIRFTPPLPSRHFYPLRPTHTTYSVTVGFEHNPSTTKTIFFVSWAARRNTFTPHSRSYRVLPRLFFGFSCEHVIIDFTSRSTPHSFTMTPTDHYTHQDTQVLLSSPVLTTTLCWLFVPKVYSV